jgi:hypothetical protein
MGAKTKRAKVVHRSTEYSLTDLVRRLRAPADHVGGSVWTRETIRAARDAQLRGSFAMPKRLAASQKTDDGLFAALRNRLSPTGGLPVELVPASTNARALKIASEAEALFGQDGVAISPETVLNLHEDLANHGVAFAVVTMTPREDGSRVDSLVSYWPIQHVRWNASERAFETSTESGAVETICHGDGRWIVVRSSEVDP